MQLLTGVVVRSVEGLRRGVGGREGGGGGLPDPSTHSRAGWMSTALEWSDHEVVMALAYAAMDASRPVVPGVVHGLVGYLNTCRYPVERVST
jgi:hypothetical protein